MHKLYLFAGLALLLTCTACGTGNGGNNGGFGGGGTAGSFSNASMSGSYAYRISGYDLGVIQNTAIPFREAGVFVADGKGNITSGEDDFAEGTSLSHSTTTGAYSISNDGTGSAVIQYNSGTVVQLALTVVNSSMVYLSVNPTANSSSTNLFANGTGTAKLQSASALASVPSGKFVFRMHNLDVNVGSSASVGAFTIAGGVVNSGNEDVLRSGAQTSLGLTGSFNTPDASGRGTGTLTDNQITLPFAYYVVDANHFFLFSLATGNIGLGQAEAQTGTFNNSTFSGSYVFGSRGDDNGFGGFLGGTNSVGQFTASNGTISGGQFDSAIDGVISTGNLTGSYNVAANGRATVTLTPSTTGTPIQEIYWMVSPARAFFLTNDTTKVEDGTADLQGLASFAKSSLNGNFSFAMDGVVSTPDLFDRVGYIHWDGAGNMGLSEFINVTGNGQLSGILNGTYTVSSNGRAVGSIGTLSNNLIFYLVSGNQAYMLQGDAGAEINGTMGQLP